LNTAVTPLGSPEADKLTPLLKPFNRVIVIVLVPLLPRVIVTLLGEADRLKFGVPPAFTVRVIVVVCVGLPVVDVPLTVNVVVPVVAVLLAVSVNVLLVLTA